MEWITAIWTKINKPLHYLVVGVALVLFAPTNLNWIGYVFAAFGLAGVLEWSGSQLRKWWANRKQAEKLRQAIATLNADEKAVIQAQIQKGEKTFYMDPFRSKGIPEQVRLASLYRGLADKGILEVSSADAEGKVNTLHITGRAWNLLNHESGK